MLESRVAVRAARVVKCMLVVVVVLYCVAFILSVPRLGSYISVRITTDHSKTPSFCAPRAVFTLDQKGRIPPLLRGNAHNVTQSVRKQAGSDVVEYLQSKREACHWAARTHACSKNIRESWPACVVKGHD